MVEELWDTFESETDFLIEARNLAEFKRFAARFKYMDCPTAYTELCTEHVVVMEYIDGISVSHPGRLVDAGYDLKEIGTKLVDTPRRFSTTASSTLTHIPAISSSGAARSYLSTSV